MSARGAIAALAALLVVAAPAGAAEGFKHTDALARSGITWTPETMDAWLEQPGAQ